MWVVVTMKVHPLLAPNTDHLHNNKNDTIAGPLNHTLEFLSFLTFKHILTFLHSFILQNL